MSRGLRVTLVGALLLLSCAGIAVAQDITRCDGPTCEGTSGNDTIVATDASQTVLGNGGDDDIELDETIAVGSDDVGKGGRGRDCIDGGAGADLMIGGPGNDNRPCEFTAFVNPRAGLTSGPGDDTVMGRRGDDSMDGISDDDTLIGNRGNDLIEDSMTNDSDGLFGSRGDDTINATDGDANDTVDGGPGSDKCSGDSGDVIKNCETVTPVIPG